jgi:histidine triad (HIT) family protein
MNELNKYNPFFDALRIFLDYIHKKQKKNPEYEVHPLIRALLNANAALEGAKIGERVMGLSHDEDNGRVINLYSVILTRLDPESIEVTNVSDLKTDEFLPLNAMVATFRLQIILDRVPNRQLQIQEVADVMNEAIPAQHFYVLGDRWKEAREIYFREFMAGRIVNIDEKEIEDLNKIRPETTWEDYPQNIRSLIGIRAAPLFDKRPGTTIITTPEPDLIDKKKVFELASELLRGRSGEQFNQPKDCIFCNWNQIHNHVLSIRNNYFILADANPLEMGHIIVIPKIHVNAIGDLPDHYLPELNGIIEDIKKAYASINQPAVYFEPGFNGQSVFHAHIHFIPGSFLLSEALESYGSRIIKLNHIGEIINIYKENGYYVLFWDHRGLQAAIPGAPTNPMLFRKIIASQLLNLSIIDWNGYASDSELTKISKSNILELKNLWNKTVYHDSEY